MFARSRSALSFTVTRFSKATNPPSRTSVHQAAAAGRHFLHVGNGLVEDAVAGRDHDNRHGLVDERNRTVLEFAGRITLGPQPILRKGPQGSFAADSRGGP